MLNLILLSVIVCGAVESRGNQKKLLKDISNKLIQLDEKLSDVQQKIESIEDRLGDSCTGTWHLGMNINPADGHIFGYTVGRIR